MNPVNPQATLEELRARMASAQLYVMMISRTPLYGSSGPDETAALMRRHLLYLWELETAGKLFGAGPLERGNPDAEAVGMIIVAVSSREEAEAIAANEPFHAAGWRVNAVRSWTLNEGSSAVLGKMMSSLAAAPAA